jgi:hypothetical protein
MMSSLKTFYKKSIFSIVRIERSLRAKILELLLIYSLDGLGRVHTVIEDFVIFSKLVVTVSVLTV